jgi:glycosyltransferase involved in cell wall biosynthesis
MTDDNEFQFRARKGLKSILRWLFVRLLDGIVVTNETVRRAYEAITPEHARVRYYVVPILHDEDRMRKEADSIMRAGSDWRKRHLLGFDKAVLYVGRLDEEKNVKWLVSQFKGIVDVALVMVGAGGLGMEIEEMVAAEKMSNVFLLGRKEGREVYEMMSMADVLVLPSSFEPYGAVVGEALQWGTPCVVSDRVGASVLIYHGENGEVFKTGDAADFQRKLFSLFYRGKTGNSLLKVNLETPVKKLVSAMYG